MAGRKRKAVSQASTPAKKVRIGSATDIPDSGASGAGRPKRRTNGPAETAETTPRGRGRPPKTELKPDTKHDGTPAKGGPGRPPKSAYESTKPIAQSRGRPATTPKISAPKSAPTRRGPGRPPKVARGPGRPPKSTAVSTAKTSKAPATKRGRPAKAAPQTADLQNGPEVETDDPLSESETNDLTNGTVDLTGVDENIQYWLMKAEPETRLENGVDVSFSIDRLAAKTEPEAWDGVRNAQARNYMRAMRKGDLAFFYHSNCSVPGIVGVMRIVREHSPDETAFDAKHPGFDSTSDPSKPKWEVVHVEFVKKFDELIGLKEMRSFANNNGVLANMALVKQSRLSVSAVTPEEWRFILDLAGELPALGHGDVAMGGYESEIDGEGEETAAASDADGINGAAEEKNPADLELDGVNVDANLQSIESEVAHVNGDNEDVNF